MGTWSFVVTDKTGSQVGELSAKAFDRNVRKPLNGARSCSFRTRIDNPLNDVLLDAGNTLVKAYRVDASGTRQLMFVGPVVTASEVGQDASSTIQFTCLDAAWRLAFLLLGKSAAGYTQGTALVPVNIATIITALLNTVNAATVRHGVALGVLTSSASSYVGPWYYKNVVEAIGELADMLNGPDWQITPLEPNAAGNIGTFNCSDYIGAAKPDAVFEYGTGQNNVDGYQRLVDAGNLLNSAYNLPSGFPDADPTQTVQTSTDADSQVAYGLREAVVDSDLTVDALRAQLLNEHVRIRKVPKQTITFQPSLPDKPAFGIDYDVGDVVGFRAVQNDAKRIDVKQRIYVAEFAIDGEGNETKTLTLAPE